MGEIVELPLDGGGAILLRSSGSGRVRPGGGPVNASPSDVVDRARQTFEQAIDGIRRMSLRARQGLSQAEPDEVTLEFGLSVEAAAGVFLTSLTSACHVTVTVKWTSKSDEGKA